MNFIDKARKQGRIFEASIEAGKHVARLADNAVARVEVMGDPDERCHTCAFRLGTPANQCADTLADAMKCIIEKEPFYCHDKNRAGHVCHGWFAASVVTKDMPAGKAPFQFSHEENKESPC